MLALLEHSVSQLGGTYAMEDTDAKQAQARARRQQQERLEGALEELQKLQAGKAGEKAKREMRVSTSDPQRWVMKQSDKGFTLSYKAQISTDAAHGLIVGVAVTAEDNDCTQLLPAVDRLERWLNKRLRPMMESRAPSRFLHSF